MVETRFDRGVYEDDEEESDSSSGGGGGGSSSDQDQNDSSGGDGLNLTENERDADIVIRDGEIVAADEDARFESDSPTQTIDSGGGGGSSSSNRQESEMDRLERIAEEGFSEQDTREPGQIKGPEKVAVESSITVEDQRTEVETSSGNTVSEADLIQKRDQAEQRKINLENQAEFLEGQGQQEKAKEARERAQEAQKIQDQVEKNIQTVNQIERQRRTSQNNNRGLDADPQRVVNETEDFFQGFNEDQGSFSQNLEQTGSDLSNVGAAVQEEGSEVGDFVERNVNEALGGGTVGRRTGQLAGGVGTLGTQAAGFFIEGGGGLIELRAQDLQNPGELSGSSRQVEGTQQFLSATGEEVSEDPLGFALEEGGEEIGEAAIGGLLLGGPGAAAGLAPNPEPEVEPEPEIESEVETETEADVSTISTELETQDIPSNDALPREILGAQSPEIEQEMVNTPETFEADGIQRTELDAGPEAVGRNPQPSEFESDVAQAESQSFVEQETGFKPEEQEVIRQSRGREDITLRQEETIEREFGPGENEPEEGATVLEAEETSTGGELIFSAIGPLPVNIETETETELNPQPPQADLFDSGSLEPEFNQNIDFEPDSNINTEQEPSIESEVQSQVETEFQNSVDPVFLEVEDSSQAQEQTQDLFEEQGGLEDLLQINQQPQVEESVTQEPETEEELLEQEIENNFRFDSRPEPEPEIQGFEEENIFEEEFIGGESIEDQGGQFAPTLGAAISGSTQKVTLQEAEQLDEQSFSGLGQRNVVKISEEEKRLEKDLGI